MSAATDRLLTKYNGRIYNPDTNAGGLDGPGGMEANYLNVAADVATVGVEVAGNAQSASALRDAVAADRTAVGNDRTAVAADRATVQGLKDATQTLRDSAAASAVLAQQSVGAATNVLFPAINYRLASQWDPATGAATAYTLTGVVSQFVYDTRKDWDFGRWRRGRLARSSSWYNESLNTATRGAKKEFPVVALVVTCTTRVIIYDLNDLDSNASPRMWMVFLMDGTRGYRGSGNSNAGAVMRGGYLVIADNNASYGGLYIHDFTRDRSWMYDQSNMVRFPDPIASRHVGYASLSAVSGGIASRAIAGVDLRVLPGAPLDPVSRLPIPTIAAATAGGTSVIHPTGLIASVTIIGGHARCALTNNELWTYRRTVDDGRGVLYRMPIPYAAGVIPTTSYLPGTTPGLLVATAAHIPALCRWSDGWARGGDTGLTIVADDAANPANSLFANITNAYTTGWMPGDTRLCVVTEGAGTAGASGGEMAVNGGFDNGKTGWSDSAQGAGTVAAGVLTVTNTQASGWGYNSQIIAVTPNVPHIISVDMAKGTVNAYLNILDNGASGSPSLGFRTESSTTLTTRRIAVVPTSSSIMVNLQLSSGGIGDTAKFDNVSCRRAGVFSDAVTGTDELVGNGGFDTDTVWTKGTGWAIGGGVATKAAGAASNLTQPLAISAGLTYAITYTLTGVTAGTTDVWLGGVRAAQGRGANGTYTDFVTATTADVLSFSAGATFAGSIDNVSVKLAIPDRSYKGKGLIVNGTLARSPVAAGSDLYEVSGFSANNFLEQPYNADLDVGTGDLCWILRGGSVLAGGYFLNRAGGTGASIFIAANNSNVSFQISDGANQAGVISNGVFTAGASSRKTWAFIVRRATQKLEIWCDGVLDNSVSCASVGSLTNTSARLRVGEAIAPSAGTAASGLAISLLRFAAYAPTPAQLAKIASDEGGAALGKMMLGGTSNSVQSLALDEDTGVLHIGTADGADQFAGLRRVGRIAANTQGIGPELLTNPSFANGTAGWTLSNATATTVNGVTTFTSTGTWPRVWQMLTGFTVGKTYVITAAASKETIAGNVQAVIRSSPSGATYSASTSLNGLSPLVFLFTPVAGQSYSIEYSSSNATETNGKTFSVGTISMKEYASLSAASVASVAAGGGAVLVGTANEAGAVTDLQPIKDELRQLPATAANGNDPVFEGVTTDATPLDIGKVFVNEGETVLVSAEVVATEYGQAPTEGASYTVRARVRRALGGNVALVGSAFHVTIDETTATMDATITVDTAAQALCINVTGKAGTRMQWRARLRLDWIGETRNVA